MRVRITFSVNNRGGLVPFHHQYLISQVFKKLLMADGHPDFQGYQFFSFSGLKGQTKVNKLGLQYTSRKVTIVISSLSEEFARHLVDLVLNQDQLYIGKLSITPEVAESELSVPLDQGMKYVCISPLVPVSPLLETEDSSKRFIDPASDEFSDLLYESTVSRMAEFGIDALAIKDVQKFQLIPDDEYLQKLRDSNKKFARIYPLYDQDVKYEARGYTFPFLLYAAPEVQEFIYTCGLGSFCHKGFGMLDLANSDPTARTVVLRTKSELVSA